MKGTEMKIAALLTAATFTCGAAMAQTGSGSAATQDPMAPRPAQTTGVPHAKPGGVVDKTKNAMHRMGDKMRHAGDRVGKHVPKSGAHKANDQAMNSDARTDTRSMGAAGSDSGRQARMDDAYANWKSRQR
jgi:hypothetical protein